MPKRAVAALLVSASLLTLCAATSSYAAVGRTEGAASISSIGAAEYSIPLSLPSGTNGLQPSLSLSYSSSSGSGHFGVGWRLTGLSAISRCAKTWAQDGVAREVRNDTADRFCLDGNQLKAAAGPYGGNGSEYRTEIETFARIRSYATAGDGPGYFIVERKDGLIYEYGNTADSQILSVGQPTARLWAVNKISDRAGNAILFTYTEDAVNGSFRIDSIRYTQHANDASSPHHEVQFHYESVPVGEVDSAYQANAPIKRIARAVRIDINHDGSLIRQYELTYEAALSSASRSRLASVRECAAAPLDCFPATTFSYQNGTAGLNAEAAAGFSVPTLSRPWSLDVNGDGRKDLLYPSSTTSGAGTWMVAFANGSGGYSTPINSGIANTNWNRATAIDYNADGLQDLIVPYSGGTWWVVLGTSSGLAPPFNTGIATTATGTGNNARAIDIDGDGLQDLVWADLVGYSGGDAIRYRLRVLGGTFSSTVYTLVGPLPADEIMTNVFGAAGQLYPNLLPDFNGDGRGDISYDYTFRAFIDGPNTWQYFRSMRAVCPGGMSFGSTTTVPTGGAYYGDFNGDGLTDLLYPRGGTAGSTRVRYSAGTSFSGEVTVLSGSSYTIPYVVLDWDGDGRDDVLVRNTSTNNWDVVRSTGESFATPVSVGPLVPSSGSDLTVTDTNGDGLWDFSYALSGAWRIRTHAGVKPDLLLTATDGFGNSSTFTYVPLSSYSNYTKLSGATFPAQEYAGPLHVVSSLSLPNGIGGSYDLHGFYYEGARLNLQGRGFLGFLFRSWMDSRDNTAQRRSYRQDFPYVGFVSNERRTQQPSGTAIVELQRTPASHTYGTGIETRWLPYTSQVTRYEREVSGTYNGQVIRTVAQQNVVDAATGTTIDTIVTTAEATSANGVHSGASYVERVYQPSAALVNDWSNWCIGRPGQVQRINSHTLYGGGGITRTTNLSWDASACRVTQQIDEPGSSTLQVTQTIGYDTFGNVSSLAVTGASLPARTTTINWGQSGRFPESITNALSQLTQLGWDASLGQLASVADPNGTTTSWTYDRFGRRTRETRPDLTATTWTYEDCTSYGCLNANNKMIVTEAQLDSGGTLVRQQQIYMDRFDRPIASGAQMLSGAYSRITREYDALGRVYRESAPCWAASCAQFWTTYSYDLLDRIVQISRPISDSNPTLQSTFSYYEGLTTRTVDPLNKQTTTVADALGRLARSIDHDGYYQSFDYDSFGNLLRVLDSASNTLQSSTYNTRGMRTAITDIDAGNRAFIPNALGEVTSQTDAKNQTTTFGYDALGRLISRVEAEGTSTFTFGTSAVAKNIGRLASMSGPGYSESFTYDSIGRLSQRTITSDTIHSIDYAYNSIGALHTLIYPISSSGYRFKLQYDYQNGALLRVKDFNAPSTVFWTANDTDPRGNFVSETLGNGLQTIRGFDAVTGSIDFIQSGPNADGTRQNLSYTWDSAGNLTQRRDVRLSLTEDFSYDNLHRLTSVTGADPRTLTYDALGNITSKSGIGNYTYDATRKHAVTAAGTNTFAYDANGNVSSRNGYSISWYSYDLPNLINGPSNNSSQLFYAPDRSRWKQVASYAGTMEQTVYIGGLVEKVTLGTTISWKHYIAGGSGPVAVYIRRSTGTNETVYLLKDHLGSVDMITNDAGNQMSRLSFDAFGKRRNGGTWSGIPAPSAWTTITNTTRRGFTFHEMLDNLNLTHMNGRVYDQLVGRFLSADPIVQAPASTQSFNRYSYTFNNPLRYTDPSGYDAGRYFYTFQNINDFYSDSDGRYTGGGTGSLSRGAAAGMADSAGSVRSGSRTERRRPASNPRHAPGRESPQCDMVPTCGGADPPVSAVDGAVFGARNFGTAARPYTLEEPVELKALRMAHPELNRAIERIWADSFRGASHEEELLVYQSNRTGRLLFNTTTLVPDGDSELTWADPGRPYFPHYLGYSLVLTVHTHPFQFGQGSSALQCFFVKCAQRGPSALDIATSKQYPSAFHMIVGVGYRGLGREHYYYGERANIDE